MRSKLEPMQTAAASLLRHKEEIMTCFEQRISDVHAEAMNSPSQSAKQEVRGYGSF